MYFLPPRVAPKRKKGTKNEIAIMGIIHQLSEKRSPTFIKLKIATKSITKNTSNAVPEGENTIS
jgi:hypothetical protein